MESAIIDDVTVPESSRVTAVPAILVFAIAAEALTSAFTITPDAIDVTPVPLIRTSPVSDTAVATPEELNTIICPSAPEDIFERGTVPSTSVEPLIESAVYIAVGIVTRTQPEPLNVHVFPALTCWSPDEAPDGKSIAGMIKPVLQSMKDEQTLLPKRHQGYAP